MKVRETRVYDNDMCMYMMRMRKIEERYSYVETLNPFISASEWQKAGVCIEKIYIQGACGLFGIDHLVI